MQAATATERGTSRAGSVHARTFAGLSTASPETNLACEACAGSSFDSSDGRQRV
jgi:hypothetical protein